MKKKKVSPDVKNLNVKGIPADVYYDFQSALKERGISIKFQVIKFIRVWLEAIKKEEKA